MGHYADCDPCAKCGRYGPCHCGLNEQLGRDTTTPDSTPDQPSIPLVDNEEVSHIGGGQISGINTGPTGGGMDLFGIIAITIWGIGVVGSIVYGIWFTK